jgi:hypothetical protein
MFENIEQFQLQTGSTFHQAVSPGLPYFQVKLFPPLGSN